METFLVAAAASGRIYVFDLQNAFMVDKLNYLWVEFMAVFWPHLDQM